MLRSLETSSAHEVLAFDIVHAVEFSRIGRTSYSASRLRLRATALTYHLIYFCQIATPLARHIDPTCIEAGITVTAFVLRPMFIATTR